MLDPDFLLETSLIQKIFDLVARYGRRLRLKFLAFLISIEALKYIKKRGLLMSHFFILSNLRFFCPYCRITLHMVYYSLLNTQYIFLDIYGDKYKECFRPIPSP
jgi:hypothetical protein